MLYLVLCKLGFPYAKIVTLEQVDLKTGVVKLYGKGNKEREVILTTEALNALKKYLNNGTQYKYFV